VLTEQGIMIGSQISWKEAHERLSDFDVLVVLGGNSEAVLKEKTEPFGLIDAFSEIQKANPARERTILSVCTGSLFLAQQGILSGLSATTHPDYITTFEILCSQVVTRNLGERTDVVEDARYVVNNLRFDLGDEDENPYIRRKADVDARRPSNGRSVLPPLKQSGSRCLSYPPPAPVTLLILALGSRRLSCLLTVRAERAPCPSKAPTRDASPLPVVRRCDSVVSV
jgi:hypothetical protein